MGYALAMERSVREIRKDIKDLRVQVADRTDAIDKTLDAASQLARSMEELVARQRRREKLLQVNSFAAYLIFTVLLGTGFWLLYNSRASELVAERDESMTAAQSARERASALQDEKIERQTAAEAAAEFYELMRAGRHSELIARYPKIEVLKLSAAERAIFEDGLKQARAEIVDAGYLAGVDAFRRGDFEAATAELRRGLSYGDEGERAAQMRYYLGLSLQRQGSQDEALRQLELAIAGGVEGMGMEDARFYLANGLALSGRVDEAREAYNKFAARFPKHRWASSARRKAATLARATRDPGSHADISPPIVSAETKTRAGASGTVPSKSVAPAIRPAATAAKAVKNPASSQAAEASEAKTSKAKTTVTKPKARQLDAQAPTAAKPVSR